MDINENYNDFLFFLIWRNVYLRNVIYMEMIILNNFNRVDFKINTDKEYQYWLNYPYKMYLKRVYFFIGGKKNINNLQRLLSILESLPENIDTVEIENSTHRPSANIFKSGFIPRSVTSLELTGSFYSSFSKGSIHSNIKSLTLNDQLSFKDIPFIQCLEGGGNGNGNGSGNGNGNGSGNGGGNGSGNCNGNGGGNGSGSIIESSNKLRYLDFGQKNKSGYSNYYKSEIKKLPNNLKELLFPDFYNEKIYKDLLPKSLTSLTFGDSFNTEINEGCLPSSITYLEFGYHFNCEIGKNVLPNELKVLKFGESFNKSLNNYCFSDTTKLEKLYIGREFDKKFNEFTFPKSLKELVFSIDCKFNHQLEVDTLPPALETLVFGQHCFKAPIKSIPTTLKHLSINCSQSLRNLTPFLKNLESLELTYVLLYNKKLLLQYNDLPTSIKSLKIIEPKLVSPELQPQYSTKKNISEEQSLTSLFLNQLLNLTHYEGPYNECLIKCNSLRSLIITSHFKDQFECDHFSTFIESIEFSSFKNEKLTPKLFGNMKNLKSIKFDYNFNNPISRVIFPNTLTNIELGYGINEVIDFKIFPNSLRSLKLTHSFNQLTLPNLPESLTCLSIGSAFQGTVSSDWLKPSINNLILFSAKCKFKFPLPKSTTIYTYYNNYNIIENQFYFENLIKNNNLKLCSDNFINSLYDNLKNI
ncbi:hypothetical protein ACTFIZ_001542 [Dictyostelium cf. discoideum]